MAHFLIIKTLDPTKITWRFVRTRTILVFIIILFLPIGLIRLDWVDSYSWSGALSALSESLALFFSRLFGVFGRLLLLGSSFFGLNLGLLSPNVLRCWDLRFNRDGVHCSIALVAILINVAADRGLHFGLGLSPHCSLDQRVPSIQFSAFFIYLKPNWWLKAFIEVPAQDVFS